MEGTVNFRLLGIALLTGTLSAACGGFGNDVERHAAVVDENCTECHNDIDLTGNMSLQRMNFEDVAADAETWEKVIAKVRAGLMPPGEAPPLDQETRESLVAFL